MNIYGILSTRPYLIVPLTKWKSINIYQNSIFKVNLEKKNYFQMFIALSTKLLKKDIN
jgi:hypothetical protein